MDTKVVDMQGKPLTQNSDDELFAKLSPEDKMHELILAHNKCIREIAEMFVAQDTRIAKLERPWWKLDGEQKFFLTMFLLMIPTFVTAFYMI